MLEAPGETKIRDFLGPPFSFGEPEGFLPQSFLKENGVHQILVAETPGEGFEPSRAARPTS